MERAGSDLTAFGETVVFLDYFKDLPDPRQAGKVIYPLPEVLLLCLLAVLAGAETFVDIARFGEKKIALLRRFRPFCHGTPAHDHLGDILSVLDAEQFQRCFVDWVAALTGAPKEVIAIDGKTLRRSGGKKGAQAAVSMSLSAFCHASEGGAQRPGQGGGQVELWDRRHPQAARPAGDRGRHRHHRHHRRDRLPARHRRENVTMKADYVLALKGNQGTLREDVELFAAEQKAAGFTAAKVTRQQTVDGDHSRIETRTTTAIHDVGWLQPAPPMAGAAGRRHGREHTRDRQQRSTRDPLLHHLARLARRPTRPRHPQPLGDREQPALGDGHRLSATTMPRPNRSGARQLHHPQAHGPQPHPQSTRQGTHCASNEKPQDGTTTSSKASSPHNPFTRFP